MDSSVRPNSTTRTAYLVYELERRAYRLSGVAFTIGRGAENSIVIREPSVSRVHAELRPEGEEYVLHTSGATGTRVNGKIATAPRQLADGDRIDVGLEEFTFRRSKLPLGVSIIDPPPEHHDPDILTRRETITNPILGGTFSPKQTTSILPILVVVVILAAAAAYYFLVMR